MLSVEEARAQILAGFEALPIVEVPLAEARGMVAAEDAYAPHDLPRFDNSAMDGYAVRRDDIRSAGTTLELIGEVRAGDPGEHQVRPGTASRVMTGAPIPPGADAVVPIEQAEESDGRVRVAVVPDDHAHVRPAGDDVKAGDPIVRAGTELGAAELAILASLGLSPVRVHRRPQVVVLSTGDELVAPEAEPAPGQIRDSNSIALRALVEEAGAVPRVVGPVADDRDAVRTALLDAATTADLIVSSGGVSVGRYDFVKEIIEEVGALGLWRVAMQPGKPVVSGRVGQVPFLGLPGNPVSIHIGFEQFVRPALRKLRGCTRVLHPTITARLGARIEKRPGRLHLVRVRLSFDEKGFVAIPTGSQGSHIQSSLLDCDGVARFGIDESVLDEGAEVVVEVWKLP